MSTQTNYLDRARQAAGLPSDYALAKSLSISAAYLSQLRHDNRAVTEPIAERLGELIGESGGMVYARIQQDRARNSDVRRFWRNVALALRSTAAAGLVAVAAVIERGSLYIMSTRARAPRTA